MVVVEIREITRYQWHVKRPKEESRRLIKQVHVTLGPISTPHASRCYRFRAPEHITIMRQMDAILCAVSIE